MSTKEGCNNKYSTQQQHRVIKDKYKKASWSQMHGRGQKDLTRAKICWRNVDSHETQIISRLSAKEISFYLNTFFKPII